MDVQLCSTAYLIHDVNHIPHLELQLVLVLRDVLEEHLALPLLGPCSWETPKVTTLRKDNSPFLNTLLLNTQKPPQKTYVASNPGAVVCLGHLRLGSHSFDK